ncbi:MAG: hypothetical protein ACMZ66_05520 [Thalassospira sp.]|uniref:hypothetical protein n=1 Tax=Thalassospira sp. TaxID=1912094 RepID=UPI003A859434
MEAAVQESTELVRREDLVPEAIFKSGAIDPLLSEIAAKARAVLPNADVSTVKGRKEIASVAYKVAQSKTLLDGLGKDLVAGWKAQATAVDVERRRVREFLDNLKDEVRQPLTDWETAEEQRIAAIKARISDIEELAIDSNVTVTGADVDRLDQRLDQIMKTVIDESFAEFKADAALAKDKAIGTVSAALGEAKEAARIAAEQRAEQEREAAERAAREKAEAEERAKLEAEQKEAERQAWEAQAKQREEAAAKAAAEEAENRVRAEAEAKARQEAAAKAKAEADEAHRIANQEHRRTINNEALKAIAAIGVSEEQAKAIVLAISNGDIPHVSMNY